MIVRPVLPPASLPALCSFLLKAALERNPDRLFFLGGGCGGGAPWGSPFGGSGGLTPPPPALELSTAFLTWALLLGCLWYMSSQERQKA